MKGNAKRVICLFLAAIIVVTTVGYAPPSFALTAMSNSRMEEALKALASPSEADEIVAEVATPSEAESPGDKATPSEAEKLEDKATPSEAVRKFIQLEPEEIPEYYSQVKNAGKRFWKFEDRNGMIQYRDYGYVDGEAEFPLWYEADQVGSVGDMSSSINLDEEYYSLAPYIYKSVVPGKKAWTDLSWRLFFDSFSIEEYVKKNITGFKNWDSSSYDIWILTGAQDDLGYHFYGVLVNETQEEREPGWYYADETGTVFNVSNMLMASLLETQNIYQYQDIPGGYRQNITTFKSSVSTSTFELKPSGDSYGSRVKTDEVLSRVNFSSNFVGWSTIRCYNNSFTILDGGNNYVQVNGDPADTIEYLSGGDLYPPYYMLDLTKDYTRNFYGIWCPQNADMYIFSNDEYVNTYDKVKYGINSIIVRRDTSLNIDSIRPASKQGFTFKGWYYRSNYNDIPILPNTELRFGSSANVTWVYPNYERNVNKVEFLDIDGNNLKTDMVLTGEAAIPPQAHEIEGMDFVGWDKSFTNVSQDMVIKAQYKKLPNIIIIYRDAPSSSANILKTETIIAKGKATPPEVDLSSLPTPKTGYHYSGTWYGIPNVDLDCIETFDSKTYYKDSTVYLYPKQEGNMIKVTLHSNDGQDVTKVIDVQYESSLYWSSVIDSQILTKGLVETRTGYTFNGWGTTPEANYSNLNNVQPYDQDLYQIWKPVPYYVIFDKCVSGESSPYKVQVIYDKPIGKLPEVTSKGLDFLGWFTYYYGGTQVTEETLMPNRDFNLYAQWSRYPTKITLDYHYEGAPNPYTYSIYTADYTYYQVYTNIADRTPYTRKGYSFKWWNTKPDDTGRIFYKGTNSSYVPESRDITVYAIWEPLNIYIRLYKNTSSSDTSELSLASRKFDSPVGKLAVPTNGDKIFKGWYTARTGGTLVSENDIVNNYTVNGTSNNWYLNAQWANSQNKVTFKDWDNSVLSEQTIDYGKDAIPPELQERAGYRFVGWDKPYENIQGDTVLTAQYEIISKTLRIVGNGGNLSDQSTIDKTIVPGESLDQILSNEKNTALRKFYTYDGWYTDPTGGSKYPDSGNKMPDSDLVIYAHWTRSSSEVVFKDCNGSVLDTQEVTIGADAISPAAPERIGYTFTGWDKPIINIQDHTILTAQYTINSYKLTLNGNGGTLAGEETKSQDFNFGESLDHIFVNEKNGAARNYYTFTGWYTAPSGGSKYPESGNLMPNADLIVYAHWERSSSEVVFKDWNGTTLDTQEVHVGANAIPPAPPQRLGYTFSGWDKPYTNIQDHSTITALYTRKSYKLSLNGNGGTLAGEETKDQVFDYGESFDHVLINGKADAARRFYTFTGWYTAPSGGSKYPESGNLMPDAEVTAYAHWERSSSEVIFKDWDGMTLEKQEVAIGANATPPEVPERQGYTFNGRDKSYSNIQDHSTITAQYTINGYLLTLDGNGGTLAGNARKEQVLSFNQSFDQVLKDGRDLVSRPGYGFDGWYNSASGGGSYSYSGNQMPAANVTLFAHWSPNTYKITFDPDHVRWDGDATIEEHTFDTRLGILPMPEIYGWRFTGWWTGKNGTGTEVTNDSMVEPKDVVYYGKWQPETYQIRFISKAEQPEGESVQAFTVGLRYDQKFGNLPVPEEKGYTFMGWYDEDNKKVDSQTIFNPDSDAEAKTYHAGWKGKTYQIRFVYNDSDGKPVVKIIDGTYGMQIGTLPSPEKPGYTFAGWFRDNGEEVTSGSWVEPGDTEYKAKWIPNKYTIHFKSNLDSMSDPEDKTVTYALPIGDLPLLHATGYVFLGWYTESSGGSLIKETTLAALGDQTYYGHWSIGLINNGNGTYRKPGSDGKWNTADDELWWYGPDANIGTEDDRQIYLMPGGNGYYVDYGNGSYLRPGAGGDWISGTELWWYGTNGKPGAGDRPIYLMPGGNGYYVDFGNGSYLKPGPGGSWTIGTELWWYGSNGKPGASDRPIYLMPGGNGYFIDNGNGSYTKPGSDGSWTNGTETWVYGPGGKPGADDRQIHVMPGGNGYYIDNGNGSYTKPGSDGSWINGTETWVYGPGGKPGDDDRQIHVMPGENGYYIDNGNGSYTKPGSDGSWTNGTETWVYGPGGKPGADDRQIHVMPGGNGYYIDNGNGSYTKPGSDGSWTNGTTWVYGPGGKPGADDRQIHVMPGGNGYYIDNGNGTYTKPGSDGSWTNGTETWVYGPGGKPGADDLQIHVMPGGNGYYIDNGDGTYTKPGSDGSWTNGTETWVYGHDGKPGADDRQIHVMPGGNGYYIDNGDGTYTKPGLDGSWTKGTEHWSSGPDGKIGTSDDKKIGSDPEPTNPEPTNPEPANPQPIKPESEKQEEEKIVTAPVIPVIDTTVKPVVPDTGGTFTVNPNNPLEVTYTKPDGTVAKNEWVGDGKDWYHVDESGNLNYDWYLEGERTWYKLNKETGDRFGAALIGWNYEPMDDKRYFFDPSTTKMLTGWQYIDNKWYYFTKQNESQTYYGSNPKGWKYDPTKPGKPYGSMYQNEITPDRYLVDENGVWKNK